MTEFKLKLFSFKKNYYYYTSFFYNLTVYFSLIFGTLIQIFSVDSMDTITHNYSPYPIIIPLTNALAYDGSKGNLQISFPKSVISPLSSMASK